MAETKRATLFGKGGLLAPIGQALGKRAKGGVSEAAKKIETAKLQNLMDMNKGSASDYTEEELDQMEADLAAAESSGAVVMRPTLVRRVRRKLTLQDKLAMLDRYHSTGAQPPESFLADLEVDLDAELGIDSMGEAGFDYRDVQGAGGWAYRQYADGSVEIIEDPRAGSPMVGKKLTSTSNPKAWNAITKEIGPYVPPEPVVEPEKRGKFKLPPIKLGGKKVTLFKTKGDTASGFDEAGEWMDDLEPMAEEIDARWSRQSPIRRGTTAYDTGLYVSDQGMRGGYRDLPAGATVGAAGEASRVQKRADKAAEDLRSWAKDQGYAGAGVATATGYTGADNKNVLVGVFVPMRSDPDDPNGYREVLVYRAVVEQAKKLSKKHNVEVASLQIQGGTIVGFDAGPSADYVSANPGSY